MANSGPSSGEGTLERLRERAQGGDPGAQVELAVSLAKDGRGAEAAQWLTTAAGNRHILANTLLGAWQIYGVNAQQDPAAGVQRLQFASGSGDGAASTLLSDLLAEGRFVERDWQAALDLLAAGAQQGNVRALTQVALLQPGENTDALRLTLLWAASTRGFPVAQALLGRALLATADPQQMQAGRGWLRLARAAGSPLVGGDTDLGGDVGVALSGPSAIGSLPWKLIRERMTIASFLEEPLRPGFSSRDLWLRTHPAFIPDVFCDYLVAFAGPYMERAYVNDSSRGVRRLHEQRTNSDFPFAEGNCDVVLRLIEQRLALAAELPHEYQEPTVILRYRPGETYDDHHDFINPAVPGFQADLERWGQRTTTALIYLNEGYEGGETHFPELDQRIRGSKGEALLWRNVREDGAPEPRTLHAGRPPTSGEKWVLSKWIRSKPQSQG